MKFSHHSFFVLLILFGLAALSSGFLLKNAGNGQCVEDTDSKKETVTYKLSPCGRKSTKFSLIVGRDSGQRLASVWTQPKGQKSKQKCAYANTDSSDTSADYVWSTDCEGRQYCPYLQWTVKELGDSKYLVVHPKGNRCLKSINGALQVVDPCNDSDLEQQWLMQ